MHWQIFMFSESNNFKHICSFCHVIFQNIFFSPKYYNQNILETSKVWLFHRKSLVHPSWGLVRLLGIWLSRHNFRQRFSILALCHQQYGGLFTRWCHEGSSFCVFWGGIYQKWVGLMQFFFIFTFLKTISLSHLASFADSEYLRAFSCFCGINFSPRPGEKSDAARARLYYRLGQLLW